MPHEAWTEWPLALVVCKADRPMQASKVLCRAHGSEIPHNTSRKPQSCDTQWLAPPQQRQICGTQWQQQPHLDQMPCTFGGEQSE